MAGSSGLPRDAGVSRDLSTSSREKDESGNTREVVHTPPSSHHRSRFDRRSVSIKIPEGNEPGGNGLSTDPRSDPGPSTAMAHEEGTVDMAQLYRSLSEGDGSEHVKIKDDILDVLKWPNGNFTLLDSNYLPKVKELSQEELVELNVKNTKEIAGMRTFLSQYMADIEQTKAELMRQNQGLRAELVRAKQVAHEKALYGSRAEDALAAANETTQQLRRAKALVEEEKRALQNAVSMERAKNASLLRFNEELTAENNQTFHETTAKLDHAEKAAEYFRKEYESLEHETVEMLKEVKQEMRLANTSFGDLEPRFEEFRADILSYKDALKARQTNGSTSPRSIPGSARVSTLRNSFPVSPHVLQAHQRSLAQELGDLWSPNLSNSRPNSGSSFQFIESPLRNGNAQVLPLAPFSALSRMQVTTQIDSPPTVPSVPISVSECEQFCSPANTEHTSSTSVPGELPRNDHSDRRASKVVAIQGSVPDLISHLSDAQRSHSRKPSTPLQVFSHIPNLKPEDRASPISVADEHQPLSPVAFKPLPNEHERMLTNAPRVSQTDSNGELTIGDHQGFYNTSAESPRSGRSRLSTETKASPASSLESKTLVSGKSSATMWSQSLEPLKPEQMWIKKQLQEMQSSTNGDYFEAAQNLFSTALKEFDLCIERISPPLGSRRSLVRTPTSPGSSSRRGQSLSPGYKISPSGGRVIQGLRDIMHNKELSDSSTKHDRLVDYLDHVEASQIIELAQPWGSPQLAVSWPKSPEPEQLHVALTKSPRLVPPIWLNLDTWSFARLTDGKSEPLQEIDSGGIIIEETDSDATDQEIDRALTDARANAEASTKSRSHLTPVIGISSRNEHDTESKKPKRRVGFAISGSTIPSQPSAYGEPPALSNGGLPVNGPSTRPLPLREAPASREDSVEADAVSDNHPDLPIISPTREADSEHEGGASSAGSDVSREPTEAEGLGDPEQPVKLSTSQARNDEADEVMAVKSAHEQLQAAIGVESKDRGRTAITDSTRPQATVEQAPASVVPASPGRGHPVASTPSSYTNDSELIGRPCESPTRESVSQQTSRQRQSQLSGNGAEATTFRGRMKSKSVDLVHASALYRSATRPRTLEKPEPFRLGPVPLRRAQSQKQGRLQPEKSVLPKHVLFEATKIDERESSAQGFMEEPGNYTHEPVSPRADSSPQVSSHSKTIEDRRKEHERSKAEARLSGIDPPETPVSLKGSTSPDTPGSMKEATLTNTPDSHPESALPDTPPLIEESVALSILNRNSDSLDRDDLEQILQGINTDGKTYSPTKSNETTPSPSLIVGGLKVRHPPEQLLDGSKQSSSVCSPKTQLSPASDKEKWEGVITASRDSAAPYLLHGRPIGNVEEENGGPMPPSVTDEPGSRVDTSTPKAEVDRPAQILSGRRTSLEEELQSINEEVSNPLVDSEDGGDWLEGLIGIDGWERAQLASSHVEDEEGKMSDSAQHQQEPSMPSSPTTRAGESKPEEDESLPRSTSPTVEPEIGPDSGRRRFPSLGGNQSSNAVEKQPDSQDRHEAGPKVDERQGTKAPANSNTTNNTERQATTSHAHDRKVAGEIREQPSVKQTAPKVPLATKPTRPTHIHTTARTLPATHSPLDKPLPSSPLNKPLPRKPSLATLALSILSAIYTVMIRALAGILTPIRTLSQQYHLRLRLPQVRFRFSGSTASTNLRSICTLTSQIAWGLLYFFLVIMLCATWLEMQEWRDSNVTTKKHNQVMSWRSEVFGWDPLEWLRYTATMYFDWHSELMV